MYVCVYMITVRNNGLPDSCPMTERCGQEARANRQ